MSNINIYQYCLIILILLHTIKPAYKSMNNINKFQTWLCLIMFIVSTSVNLQLIDILHNNFNW